MISYDEKELQAAGERLQANRDFQLLTDTLKHEYMALWANTKATDAAEREVYYQRHTMLTELQEITTELDRLKKESDRHG